MNNAPLISVVMASYNAAEYLPTTLRSILQQSFRDFELIVVNDGSTDGTADVLARFAADDPRLKPINRPSNHGRSIARNAGLDAARGAWVCPTDADDLWAKGRLASFIHASQKFPNAEVFTDDLIDFTVGDAGEIELGHRYVSRSTWWVGGVHRPNLAGWYRDRECHMTAMVRRDLLDRRGIRFPEHLSSGEDTAFYLQLAFAPGTPPPVRIAEPNYYYRVGESTRAANMAESRIRVMRLACDATGNQQLRELADATNPSYVAIYQRADRIWAENGRSAPRDPGSDEVALHGDRFGGYRQLAFNKVFEMLGRLADRHLRPGIAADIARQIGATRSV